MKIHWGIFGLCLVAACLGVIAVLAHSWYPAILGGLFYIAAQVADARNVS